MLMQETGVTVADTRRGQSRGKKKGIRNMTSLYFHIKDEKGEAGCKKEQNIKRMTDK